MVSWHVAHVATKDWLRRGDVSPLSFHPNFSERGYVSLHHVQAPTYSQLLLSKLQQVPCRSLICVCTCMREREKEKDRRTDGQMDGGMEQPEAAGPSSL